MRKPLKLHTQLSLLTMGVVLMSVAVLSAFTAYWLTTRIEQQTRSNIMNVAEMVAHSQDIIKELRLKDPQHKISAYVNTQLSFLKGVGYIIVADQADIRYSHPNESQIGKHFTGGDELRVIEKGDTYFSEATGSLGKAIRAFVPIYDPETREQIGFVSVGTLISHVDAAKRTALTAVLAITAGALFVGAIGAFAFASAIKKTLMGLEPDEIAKLYHEKMGILDAIHEGLIAVDHRGHITMINDSALAILHYDQPRDKESLIGQSIEHVLPTTGLIQVLTDGESEFNQEQQINSTLIVTNRVPIRDKGKIVGAIATFRDRTEVTQLAEELTGIQKMAFALRAQNHEYMNKLHAIAGLIQLEEYDEALHFIAHQANMRSQLSSLLTEHIADPYLAAILLSKYSRAEESRIKLSIDPRTHLESLPPHFGSEALVSVVGNLIENAIEALPSDGTGVIKVLIHQDATRIAINIADNGPGIPEVNRLKVFEQGFTTKEGQRGHGMFIVESLVSAAGGEIDLISNEGTSWVITVPMNGGSHD